MPRFLAPSTLSSAPTPRWYTAPGLATRTGTTTRMTDFSHSRNLRAVALGVAPNRLLPPMRQLHEMRPPYEGGPPISLDEVPPRNLIASVHPMLKYKSGDSG